MSKRYDLTNKMFGKWKVLEFNSELSKWKCECQCDLKTIKYHASATLVSGNTHECIEGRKAKVNSNYFNTIDTQEKAYIYGLFMADACNYEDRGRIKIDLSEDTSYILDRIKEEMQYEGNIKRYQQKDKLFGDKYYKAKPQYRLIISDRNISEQLALKGCVSNKSGILKFPSEDILPEILYSHFVRGYFDGNGYLGYWVDNKNTGHLKFNMDFTGSDDFILHLSKYIGDNFKCTPNIQRRFPDRDNSNMTIKLCGNQVIQRFCDWMYEGSVIHLDRKYQKYLVLLEQNSKIKDK